VFEVLTKVAFFQPRPCLALLRWALDHPAAPIPAPTGSSLTQVYTDQDVRDAACPVLSSAAATRAPSPRLPTFCGSSPRPGQHPQRAMRILAELAAYQRTGPTLYQDLLLACVERWLTMPCATARDPLEALHPLLVSEGHEERWARPDTLTLRPFLLDPQATAVTALRSKALDLAFTQMDSPDPRRVAAAL
jgi:hypothetical protein